VKIEFIQQKKYVIYLQYPNYSQKAVEIQFKAWMFLDVFDVVFYIFYLVRFKLWVLSLIKLNILLVYSFELSFFLLLLLLFYLAQVLSIYWAYHFKAQFLRWFVIMTLVQIS